MEHRSIGELHRTDLNMKKKEKRKRSSKEQEAGKKAILVSVQNSSQGDTRPLLPQKRRNGRKGNETTETPVRVFYGRVSIKRRKIEIPRGKGFT